MILLFDMFGVIARDQSPEVMAQMSGDPAFWEAYWAHRPAYDAGAVSADEYWRLVGSAPMVEADVASWSRVDDEMVALLGELHAAGRRIALLSNIPENVRAAERAGMRGHHFQGITGLRAVLG